MSYHSGRFPCDRHCGSEYIKVLVCHVILQVHMTRRYCDVMGRAPQSANFDVNRHCGKDIGNRCCIATLL